MITAVFAGSATWKADPIDDNWSNAGNWTPETVPNGPDDVATFANSDTTTVVINAATEIEEMVFQPGPDSFQITLDNLSPMTISGVGMSNQSGRTQVVKTGSSFGGGNEWSFVNSASAGSMMSFIRKFNSKISFYDTATAATASFFNHGPLTITGNYGIYFFAEADAGTATFTNFAENTGSPAFIGFYGSSSAASGTFAGSGDIIFAEESTAANASFSIGGNVFFSGNATATNATFTITDFEVSPFLLMQLRATARSTTKGASCTLILAGQVGMPRSLTAT